jgi:hypothetical protein
MVPSQTKQCSTCRETKATSEFSRCSRNIDGLQYRCKSCGQRATKESNAKRDPESLRRAQQKWYRKNRTKILAHYAATKERRSQTTKAWTKRNSERSKLYSRKFRKTDAGKDLREHQSLIRRFREHGITLDEYHSMAERQNFLCAICKQEPKNDYGGSHDGFHIDHHHVTGKVRGLLCDTCNVGIGMLKDSAEVCGAAQQYLARF